MMSNPPKKHHNLFQITKYIHTKASNIKSTYINQKYKLPDFITYTTISKIQIAFERMIQVSSNEELIKRIHSS